MNLLRSSTLIVTLAMTLAAVACTDRSESTDPKLATGAPDSLATADVDFFEAAAQIGMLEVSAAKLAGERGQAPNIKSYADLMVKDHTQHNAETKALAQRKGVTLPTQLDSAHQGKLDDLVEIEAGDFDKAYAETMVDGHQDAVDLFKTTAEDSEDAEIRAFAKRSLPTLQHHLEMAKALNGSD